MSGAAAIASGMGDEIADIIDAFCDTHLSEECRIACRSLLETLGNLVPSPFVARTHAAWAAGIIRTVGWINCLDAQGQSPFMRFLDIDRILELAPGTAGITSQTIRNVLKIGQFDVRWTLPSKRHVNPLVWVIELPDGRFADVRYLPRDVQVEAHRRGLIPYVYADRRESS